MVNATEVGTYRSGMSNSPDPSTVQQSNSMPHEQQGGVKPNSSGGYIAPGNTNGTNASQTASTPTPNGPSNGSGPLREWAAQVGESTPDSGDPTDSDDFGKSGGKGQEEDNGKSEAWYIPPTTMPLLSPTITEIAISVLMSPIVVTSAVIGVLFPTSMGDDDIPKVRVRHYTNNKGIDGIQASGVILPQDKGCVFVELANKKPLSPKDAESKYQIDPGRGRNYVETDIRRDRLTQVYNTRTQLMEYRIPGEVDLQNPTFVRRK